jgi:PAS domain S-box-containing protein
VLTRIVELLQASAEGGPGRCYALACLVVGAATLARLALDPLLGGQAPFLLFTLAVLACVPLGTGPALLATALGAVLGDLVFVSPRWALGLDPPGLRATALFAAVGVAVVGLGRSLALAELRLEAERRAGHARTRAAGDLLQTVIDDVADPVSVKDREGRLVFVNQAAARRLGVVPEGALGRAEADFLPARVATAIAESDRRVVREGRTLATEETFPGPAGGVTYLAVRSPWRGRDGRVMGVTTVSTDITERKHAEAELAACEARFRRALAQAPFPVMLWAEDGEVLQLSAAWGEMTGYDPAGLRTVADWAERAWGERRGPDPGEVDRLHALGCRLEQGERTVATAWGDRRVWQLASAPLGRDERGRRLVVTMAADVTARKEAEDALRRLASGLALRAGGVG